MNFTPSYQADLLAACYSGAPTLARIKSFIKPEHFTIPQLRWLFELACFTFDSSKALPTPGLVSQEASSVFTDPNEFATLIEVHADIIERSRDANSMNSVVERAAEFASQANFESALLKSMKLIEAGRIAEAMALTEPKRWQVTIDVGKAFGDTRALRGYDDFDKFTQQSKERRDAPGGSKLPTGIVGLDLALHGGLALCEMTTIVGFTGRGKSSLLYNFVDSFIMLGFPTIMVLSEMRPDQVFARLLARRTQTAHNIIFNYSFSPQQEREYLRRVEMFKSSLVRKLYIDQVGTDKMTRETIVHVIDRGTEYLGDVAAVAVDTVDHTKLPREHTKDAQLGRKENANWIHQLFDDRGVAGVCTSQANRDGFKWTDLNNMADTMEFARISEVVIAVNDTKGGTRPNPEDHIDELLAPPRPFGSMTISTIKSRGGPKEDFPVSTDLACAFMGDQRLDVLDKLG